VDAWIIQSKHAMEYNKLKDNYSWNLKSMSKTISPFLIKLTMTHKMKFVSSAVFVSVTWDVIWILVKLTFFSNLHMLREYIHVHTNLWDGRVPMLMDLECSGTMGSSSFLVEKRWGSYCDGEPRVMCPWPHLLFIGLRDRGPPTGSRLSVPNQDAVKGSDLIVGSSRVRSILTLGSYVHGDRHL
jgi:hypothetical protein